MSRRLTQPLLMVCATLAIAACRPPGDGAIECGALEPRNDDEVALCNELDQAVLAHVAMPAGEPPPGGFPAVVVMHGSGGLFLDPEEDSGETCSQTLQDQFLRWEQVLNDAGYAAIMPGSFYSRGFCDWRKRLTVPRKYKDEERMVTRVFDAYAAGDYLCDQPEIDCSRVALLGFSNGASVSILSMHETLSDADDSRLRDLDLRGLFGGAVAYYPGCSLESQVTISTESSRLDEFYFPSGPILVQHAEKDSLLDNCEDIRLKQTAAVSADRGISPNPFELVVWPDADHGFDVPMLNSSDADVDAFWAATETSLDHLDAILVAD